MRDDAIEYTKKGISHRKGQACPSITWRRKGRGGVNLLRRAGEKEQKGLFHPNVMLITGNKALTRGGGNRLSMARSRPA